jgi:hypothetical protein
MGSDLAAQWVSDVYDATEYVSSATKDGKQLQGSAARGYRLLSGASTEDAHPDRGWLQLGASKSLSIG